MDSLFEEFDNIRVALYLFLDALQKEEKKFSGRTGKLRPGIAKFLSNENVGSHFLYSNDLNVIIN